jgi:hypothetical protein
MKNLILCALTIGILCTPIFAQQNSDVIRAIAHSKRLIQSLEAVGWDASRIPRELRVLPDQGKAEILAKRTGESFVFVCSSKLPLYHQVAFFTDLYARSNRRSFKNNVNVKSPEGFWLVAWKDGRVTKVPVGDIRVIVGTTPRGKKLTPVFPGMDAYDENLPRHPLY